MKWYIYQIINIKTYVYNTYSNKNMAGGLMNIISQGNENVMINGDPTCSYFASISYQKHRNFGLQKFRLNYDSNRDLNLTTPSTFRFRIPKYADLLMDCYIGITLPNIWSPIYPPTSDTGNRWAPYDFRWIQNIGTNIVQEIEISCGSWTIAKYSGAYLNAVVDRDFNTDKKNLFWAMTGNVPDLNDPANASGRTNTYPSAYLGDNTDPTTGCEPSIRGRQLYIPINSWFTWESRCALPIMSLSDDIYITITLRPIQHMFCVRDVFDPTNNFPYVAPDFNQTQFQMYKFLQSPPTQNITVPYANTITSWNSDIHLISTYVFLSEEDKIQYAQPQTYLVKEVFEYTSQNITGTKQISLTSNGMISSWMWFLRRNDAFMRNEWSNYTNWPYSGRPSDVQLGPQTSKDPTLNYLGPFINPDNTNTGFFISGDFAIDNQKEILQSMAIVLDGNYRENVMVREIFDYIEKYNHTPGFATQGLYCYNFCLNSDARLTQPSGAMNLSQFRNINLELTTFVPQIDPDRSTFQVICDSNGNTIATSKSNWKLYEYAYDFTLFEERYNIVSITSGMAGMLLAR